MSTHILDDAQVVSRSYSDLLAIETIVALGASPAERMALIRRVAGEWDKATATNPRRGRIEKSGWTKLAAFYKRAAEKYAAELGGAQ